MSLFEAVRLALAQIRVQKLKSFFTLLGVTIGVTFLIAVVSIVGGMSRYMREELVGKIIAVNSFEVRHRPNINMGDVDESVWREYARRRRIRVEDVKPVTEALPGGTLWAVQSENNVRAESRYARPRTVWAIGVTEDWFAIKRWDVSSGRLITPQEYALGAPVLVQSESQTVMLDAMERVRQVMRSRHNLRPGQSDDFVLETSDSALEFWNKIKGYMVIAGVALPAIGLVVGAIVIMNIMLVAVAERTREIGIRKSLGARRKDILRQFLVEAATLSTLGAVIGIALGISAAKFIEWKTPLPAAVAPWSLVAATMLGMVVGIVSGVYPARRAARLDPIEALRQE